MPDGEDWMQGHRAPLPKPRPLPPPGHGAPADWQPGQTTASSLRYVCPRCGSDQLTPHDNGRAEAVERWDCKDCEHSFKLPRKPRRKAWYPG